MRKKNKNITLSGNNRRKTDPLRVNMARIFFSLNAVLWLAYGIYIYYDMAVVNHNTSSADVVTLFAFVNAGLLIFSAFKFSKPKRWIYLFVLALMVFNTLLSLVNIIDLYFLVSFIFDLLILWAILPLRKSYLSIP
jgi:hypothetical protein